MPPTPVVSNSPSDLGLACAGLFWVQIWPPRPQSRFLEVKDYSAPPPAQAEAGPTVGLGEDWVAWLTVGALETGVTVVTETLLRWGNALKDNTFYKAEDGNNHCYNC